MALTESMPPLVRQVYETRIRPHWPLWTALFFVLVVVPWMFRSSGTANLSADNSRRSVDTFCADMKDDCRVHSHGLCLMSFDPDVPPGPYYLPITAGLAIQEAGSTVRIRTTDKGSITAYKTHVIYPPRGLPPIVVQHDAAICLSVHKDSIAHLYSPAIVESGGGK